MPITPPQRRPHGPAGQPRLPAGRRVLGACAIAVFTLIAHFPALDGGFIWDDHSYVEDNPALFGPGGLKRIWFSLEAPQYYPLVFTSFWLERAVWGVNPVGYHWVNLLIHTANALLLWRLLERLNVPGAWLAGAFFALHPVNVETVAWITERKNTLAMLFYLLSLLCFLRFDELAARPPLPGEPRPGRSSSGLPASRSVAASILSSRSWLYTLSLVSFLLAMLSKTAVAPLGVVLLGLAWWRRGGIGLRDVLRSAAFLGVALLLMCITVFVERRAVSEILRPDPFFARLAGAGAAFWFYLYKAIVPVNLMFVYPRWRIDPANVLWYVPGLLAVGTFWLFWRFRQVWGRPWLAGLGYFAVMLSPALGLVNIFFMRYSLVSDHWTYFALIGPLALVAGGITRGLERFGRAAVWLQPVISGPLLLALGVLTFRQSAIYQDEETLWRDTLARNPACWMARCNLGVSFAARGKVDDAIEQYQLALQLEPDAVEIHYNMANELAALGKVDEAISHLERALELEPNYAEAHNNLGVQLARQGESDQALAHFERAVQLNPSYAEAGYNLGLTLARQGRIAEAVQHFRQTFRVATAQGKASLATDSRAQIERYPSAPAAPTVP